MKLVFPQPICPTTKTLLENVQSYWEVSLIAKTHSKCNFLLFGRSLYFDYFERFTFMNRDEKMLAFAPKYPYKWNFCCFFPLQIFPFE